MAKMNLEEFTNLNDKQLIESQDEIECVLNILDDLDLKIQKTLLSI